MEGETFEKAVQGMGAALGEVWAEAVAANVLHFVLVWEWGDGTGGVFLCECFVEKDEICEAAADGEGGLLKGLEICLEMGQG